LIGLEKCLGREEIGFAVYRKAQFRRRFPSLRRGYRNVSLLAGRRLALVSFAPDRVPFHALANVLESRIKAWRQNRTGFNIDEIIGITLKVTYRATIAVQMPAGTRAVCPRVRTRYDRNVRFHLYLAEPR